MTLEELGIVTLDELAELYRKQAAQLDEAEEQVEILRACVVNALGEFQNACPHPVDHVLQGESVGIVAPFRVCTDCGYAEQGWGVGYTRLTECHDHNVVARPAAMFCVRGGVIPTYVHPRAKSPRGRARLAAKYGSLSAAV